MFDLRIKIATKAMINLNKKSVTCFRDIFKCNKSLYVFYQNLIKLIKKLTLIYLLKYLS